MENLTLIAVGVFVLWLISFGIYLYATRQQSDLDREISKIESRLKQTADHEGA